MGHFRVVCGAALLLLSETTPTLASQAPVNHALTAAITADSEYSGDYKAGLVADGKIPRALGNTDMGKVWCVRGETHRKGAELTMRWESPVEVAELVCYARTAWYYDECWKDYELFVDDALEPVVKGRLEQGHGAQRIRLKAPVSATKLRLAFVSSYGGPNPGISELQVYSAAPPESLIGGFSKAPPPEQPGKSAALVSQAVESADLAKRLHAGDLGFRQMTLIQRNAIRPTHVYTYHAEGLKEGGGLYVLTLNGAERRLEKIVDSPDGVVLDSNLSYDGKVILFSWRRSMAGKFQIYTVNVDGSDLKQVSTHDSNNMNACWLPDGGIGFLSDRKAAFAYCWVTTSPVLYRSASDGTDVVRISANYLNDFTPSVMRDGRIIYSRWEYVDRPAIPIQSLWTINQDGTGLAGFFGNRVLSPATFMEAREIPGTRKVLCVMTSHNGPCRGAIGIIDAVKGSNAQEAITNVTPEVRIDPVHKGAGNNVRGPYESPFPLDDEYYLVSRDGTIQLRDYDNEEKVTILERKIMGFYSPQPVRASKRPLPIQASLLDKAPQDESATLVVQDVYSGLEPYVERGEIKQIAVIQEVEKSKRAETEYRAFGFQFPVVSCGATYAPKKIWGYAEVEDDGSAHFKVPTGLPLYFMALDKEGRALQRMRTFTHLMPGETQSCVGCHTDRNSVTPRQGSTLSATMRPPQDLTEPEWGVGGFSYARLVQPVLDKHCVDCHNARSPAGGVDLGADQTDFFNVSYEVLAREGRPGQNLYTKWIPTYNGQEANILEVTPRHWGSPASRLAELVRSGHPDEAGEPRVAVEPDAQRRIFAWIDLDVPYYGTSESRHYTRPGCRQMLPAELASVLEGISARRCAACHDGGVPRKVWTRISHPELNSFLLAPLAKAAGGAGLCGESVFESTTDADYQAILATFGAITELLERTPRLDLAQEPGCSSLPPEKPPTVPR